MRAPFIVAAILSALIAVAHATIGQNIGGGISTFDNGISFDGTGGFTPPVGCASTGIFNLSNTCNDIYLLTGSL